MAHTFIRRMVESDTKGYTFKIVIFLIGSVLLLNSCLAGVLYPDKEFSALPAIISAILFGLPLVYNALRDLFTGNVEMNELAALSFVASFCTCQYRTASVIALFMIISHLIEYRSQLSARKNIEALMKLAPSKASVLVNDTYIEIDTKLIKNGDQVQVLPGDKIPGDGIVLEGFSTVDESAITGESLPSEKKVNSMVYNGTVNMTGRMIIKITAKSDETILSKIKDLIDQAQKSRTPVMRLVNKYASWYTPSILMIAGILLFFTRDVDRAISLLIISCPCTIILSSPTALVAALSAAARLGVIFRNVSVLERANLIDTFIFDKTGTLTYGCLNVVSIRCFDQMTAEDILYYTGSLEQYSHHPVAKAVIKECFKREIILSKVDDFFEFAGMGISGTIDGKPVCTGRSEWILTQCTSGTLNGFAEDTSGSYLYVVIEGKHKGTIQFLDVIKSDASSTIRTLRNCPDSEIIMITGDRTEVAEKIALHLGCAFKAEMLPKHKMDCINDAKSKGHFVAMIGDGINDAPALAAGDVSIAMGGTGSDVAIHSASIVIMNDKLDRIPFVFDLSRKTVKIIRQNLAFSISFIVLMVGLSATGVISPVLAAILHSFSTVTVIFNSARLLKEGENIT